MPVQAIKTAPASSKLRRSYRGAMKPTASVNNAVPSSDALAIKPICAALKLVADKYAGSTMIANPSPKPRTPRAT